MSAEIGRLQVRTPLSVEELDRWVTFGATWRVVEISDRRVIVDMCQCTGELAQRRESSDPVVLDYLRNHPPADA
jgi:hypothetical protein